MYGRFTGPYPNGVSPSFVDDPILAGAFDELDPDQPSGHISTRYMKCDLQQAEVQ